MGKPDQTPSTGEDALFREAAADARPLAQDRAEPYHARPRPVRLDLPDGSEEDGFTDVATATETPDFLEFMRPGVQRRLQDDLRRGLLPPEATLDLHGMRVADARLALQRFLAQSLEKRRRCVRVIHGKGFGSGGRTPVLKEKVNCWLPQRPEVLAFCSAPRWDGGTGAIYALLSRRLDRPR